MPIIEEKELVTVPAEYPKIFSESVGIAEGIAKISSLYDLVMPKVQDLFNLGERVPLVFGFVRIYRGSKGKYNPKVLGELPVVFVKVDPQNDGIRSESVDNFLTFANSPEINNLNGKGEVKILSAKPLGGNGLERSSSFLAVKVSETRKAVVLAGRHLLIEELESMNPNGNVHTLLYPGRLDFGFRKIRFGSQDFSLLETTFDNPVSSYAEYGAKLELVFKLNTIGYLLSETSAGHNQHPSSAKASLDYLTKFYNRSLAIAIKRFDQSAARVLGTL